MEHRCRGPWSYYLLIGRDEVGKRRQVTRSGFATKHAAQAALRDLLAREDAEIAELHRLTVSAYLKQWLDSKRKIRPTTRRGYESHVRLYLGPHLGRVMLAELRPHHLDAMYAALAKGTDRSPATVHRVHATLRSALNAALKRRLIPWNPALHVELPSAGRPETSVWTPEQLGHFLDEIVSHRLSALFHLVALAGLRRGEALGLRWVDVDLDTGTASITQQLLDTGAGLAFGPPKTRSGVRTVSLDVGTVQVLLRHAERQSAERRAWGDAWVDQGLVFTRENGNALRPDYVSRLFLRLAASAALPRIRLHDLRHTSASLALAAGVPMKVVSDRLGHSSTSITADLYTHVVPAVSRDAADRIAAMVPRLTRPNARAMSSPSLASEPQLRAAGGTR